VNQTHGLGPLWLTIFIEYRPLAKQSVGEIRSHQTGIVSSIWAADQGTDGKGASSLGRWCRRGQGRGDAMAEPWGSSSLRFRAQKRWGLILQALEVEGNLFYKLTVKEMV
jgi:hypothetical protein